MNYRFYETKKNLCRNRNSFKANFLYLFWWGINGNISVFGIEKCFKFQKQKYFSFSLSVAAAASTHSFVCWHLQDRIFYVLPTTTLPFFRFCFKHKTLQNGGEDENNLKNLFLPSSFIQSLSAQCISAAAVCLHLIIWKALKAIEWVSFFMVFSNVKSFAKCNEENAKPWLSHRKIKLDILLIWFSHLIVKHLACLYFHSHSFFYASSSSQVESTLLDVYNKNCFPFSPSSPPFLIIFFFFLLFFDSRRLSSEMY